MDERTIEPWQAARLQQALFPSINYLARLRRRMEQVGFISKDKLFDLVCKVYDSMHALYNELHYVSCETGRAGVEKAQVSESSVF